jgi:rubredoxin
MAYADQRCPNCQDSHTLGFPGSLTRRQCLNCDYTWDDSKPEPIRDVTP